MFEVIFLVRQLTFLTYQVLQMFASLMIIQIKPIPTAQSFVAAQVVASNLTFPGHRFAAMERFMIGQGGCVAMVHS